MKNRYVNGSIFVFAITTILLFISNPVWGIDSTSEYYEVFAADEPNYVLEHTGANMTDWYMISDWLTVSEAFSLYYLDGSDSGSPFVVETGTENNLLYLDSNQRIGIRTSTPGYTLDAVGDRIRLRNSTAATARTLMLRSDGTETDVQSENADLFLRSVGNDIVMNPYGSDGDVGIGRHTPLARLHVGDGNASTLPVISGHTDTIISDTSAASDRAYLSIIAGSTTGISRINFGDTAQENVGFFSYSHSNNSMQVFAGNNEVMRFVNSKMGIGGEVSPDSTLSIKGNAAIGAGYSGSAAGPANGMIVEGNVGIGTTSPNGKLDVNGSIYQRGGVLHADYVFEPDYQLDSIEKHAEFMWQNKHLKAMPKATVDENGNEIVEVGAHRKGIVEELEIAHIYIEQLQNQIRTLEERLSRLEN